MIQLSALRSKLTWPLLVAVLFYLAAALVAAAVYFPAQKESKRLFSELEQLEQNVWVLQRIVDEKPDLERQLIALVQQKQSMLAQIPSQYDLPEVLVLIRELAAQSGLKVEELTHVPLQISDSCQTVVPLCLEATGGELIFAFLQLLAELVPSLEPREISFSYLGSGRFRVSLRADLHLLVVEYARGSFWQPERNRALDLAQDSLTGFGLPFALVSKFLGDQVKVLGVINSERESRALVTLDGVQRWVKAGDRLGEATVNQILSKGILLDLDGVFLNLTIGG